MSTARAPGETPKETFETPSEVFTPGISALIAAIPSIVSTAEGRHSSSPVVSVNVRQSKISSSGSRPCSSQHRSRIRLAISTLRCAVFAIPTSSIVSAISAAPCASASGTTRSSFSRPASRFTELTIARPGICSSARCDHLGLGRVDLDRRGLGQRDLLGHQAHLFVLVRALGQRHAQVEHVRAARHLVLGDLHEPVVVVGQQQLLGLARALRVHALADHRRARLLHERRRGDHRGEVRWRGPAWEPGALAPTALPSARRAPRSRRCARASSRSSRRRSPTP